MQRTAIRARLLDFIADPTHSVSAARLVDDGLILVEDGRVAATGTLEELLETCPGFRKLWEREPNGGS